MTRLQAKKTRLEADALGSAHWRGHVMGKFASTGKATSEAFCQYCGRGAFIDAKPAPNGIEVHGEAVALGCNRLRVG